MTYICGQRCEDCADFLGGRSLKVAVEVSRFPPLGIRGPWGLHGGGGGRHYVQHRLSIRLTTIVHMWLAFSMNASPGNLCIPINLCTTECH